MTLLTRALYLPPFLVYLLAGTVNKSNVVTASTSIQLLDERKSPVVAGKQWISMNEYKASEASSTYLATQLLPCTRKLVSKRKTILIHSPLSPMPGLCQLVLFDVNTGLVIINYKTWLAARRLSWQ